MKITPALAFKMFVTATAIAGLVDMYILQRLKQYSDKFSSEEFTDRNLKWVSKLRVIRHIVGDTTIGFMKTRTILFPTFEFTFGALALVSLYKYGLSVYFFRTLILLAILLALALISGLDDEPGRSITPDVITYPGMVIGLLTSLIPDKKGIILPSEFVHFLEQLIPSHPNVATSLIGLGASLLGVVVGGGLLWLIREIYWHIHHIEGLGLGVVKASAVIGAFCNWRGAFVSMFIGSLFGSIYGLFVMFRRGSISRHVELPFTPFIAIGGVIAALSRP